MKRIKKIAGILAILSCAFILFYKILIGNPITVQDAGAIGIIGGADGPTVIYTTAAANEIYYEIACFAPLFFSALWLILPYMRFKDK